MDEDAVAEVAKFDGYAGIITNSTQDISVILEHYHGLWAVEESFRIVKHDLKMRPICHQKNRPHQGSYCDLFCGTNVRETPELSVRNPIYKIISCRYSG